MEAVLSRAIGELDGFRDLSSDEFYFYLLATFHEGMHAEALTYTRQTLGYAAPRFTNAQPKIIDHHPLVAFRPDDVEIPGETFVICVIPVFPFVLDNEIWAHLLELKSFRLARAPV